MGNELDYGEIRYRLQNHGSFRLLRKEKAALILAFFLETFKRGHRSDVPRNALASELTAFREYVALAAGEEPDGRASVAYLDEWADDGFLRKYYREGADEPSYDLTPESEMALEWLQELSVQRFVGTESRLIQIFELMRTIVYGAAFDVDERMMELERKKEEIEVEINRVRSGAAEAFDPTAIRERYYALEDTARRLLSDFRQIETNFRDLDRDARTRVIEADRGRGRALKDIFDFRDAILSGDQGKSFRAFWSFIMSADRQTEFATLADRVLSVREIEELPKDLDLRSFDRLLVAAGARVQRTAHLLNEELRRFLDEKNRTEGRAVSLLAEEIKRLALAIRDTPQHDEVTLSLEGSPEINLVMERPLFEPKAISRIGERPEDAGRSEADAGVLLDQDEIDWEAIRTRVHTMLANRSQISLKEILAVYPIEGGNAELLGYLSEAAEKMAAVIDDDTRTELWAENLKRGKTYRIDAPSIIFLRERLP